MMGMLGTFSCEHSFLEHTGHSLLKEEQPAAALEHTQQLLW